MCGPDSLLGQGGAGEVDPMEASESVLSETIKLVLVAHFRHEPDDASLGARAATRFIFVRRTSFLFHSCRNHRPNQIKPSGAHARTKFHRPWEASLARR